MANPTSYQELTVGRNFQIPNSDLHEAFGELNITRREDHLDILLTVLVDPSQGGSAENWQTGVALDGSASMQDAYGANYVLTQEISPATWEDYVKRGLATSREIDGNEEITLTSAGYDELMKANLFRKPDNEVQKIAREAMPYLAEKLDEDGGTTLIYWACGERGDGIEVAGDLTGDEARAATYGGPKDWGNGTRLMPAINYFMERFSDAKMGFYVFLTDGSLDDFEEVKAFTMQLSRDVHAKKVNDVKLILIGMGDQINRRQLEELDDLPDEYDLPVDIWDHKIAEDMRGLSDLFAELVDENIILAPTGRILDDSGEVAKNYSDGVPALMEFSFPLASRSLTLEIGDGKQVTQNLFGS
jgi:hypothetical protein